MSDYAEEKKPAQGPAEMDDTELVVLLEEMNKRAVGALSDEVSTDQDDNLDRYLGQPYGDEEEGRSQAISMDVAEVVDWALPDLLEPFVAGDRIVEFEPSTQQDEAYADQATDLCGHVFWAENPGFLVLHDTIKSALIQKIGFIKTVWRDEEKEEEVHAEGLSLINVQEFEADDSVEIREVETEPAPQTAEAMAAYPDGMVYEIKGVRRVKSGCNVIMSVPPEEIKVSSRAVHLTDVEYIAHESEKTRGALISMGFDADVVMGLSSDLRRDQVRSDTRFFDEERSESTSRKKASDLLLLVEEYPLVDVNGDGKLERLQVFRVGKTILERRPVTEHPFDAWTADRIPHRLIGQALADKVKQTQRIKTHLTRQLLDNVYLANNPRIEVPESAMTANGETIEDLLNVRIGGLIRTRQPGQLNPVVTPDRSKTALDAILYMDNVREQQSGITRNGFALDSEAVDPKSATQVRKEDRNEQSRKRLMARMIAETLLVPVFRKLLRNLVTYQDQPKWVRLRQNWVPMDPRAWNADMRCRPSVGLGYSNQEEMLAASMAILNVQKEAMAAGLATPTHLFASVSQLVKAVGWRWPEKYFVDPSSPEGQQALQAHAQSQGQDPKMLEVQGKQQMAQIQAQLDQAKTQHAAQLKEAELTARMREAQVEAESKRQIAIMQANFDKQIAEMRLQMEMQQARERTAAEMDLAYYRANQEADLARDEMKIKARTNGSGPDLNGSGGGVRFGGNIG